MAKATAKATQKDELIDNHVSNNQCKKAVDSLTSHAVKIAKKRDENELLEGKEENVWLVLTVKRSHPEKKLKPQRIPLRYPVVDPRTTAICLITKDPQREYKDLLEQHGIKFISRVVGIEKLKGKFKPFEARRMLLKENGMFLADERVVPLLPGLLGKKFFEAKKQPIPVNLTKRELKTELELAISSSYMHQNQGTCSSIKIGTLSHSPAQVLENLKTALPAVVKKVRGGWDNVQSFNIKTNSSISLPIWSCALGDGAEGRWGAVEAKEGEKEEAGSEDEVMDVVDAGKGTGKKGKKREAEGDEATPKKKAKKVVDDTTKSAPVSESVSALSLKTKIQPKLPASEPAPDLVEKAVDAILRTPQSQPEESAPASAAPSSKKEKKKKSKASKVNGAEETSAAVPANADTSVQTPAKKSKSAASSSEPPLAVSATETPKTTATQAQTSTPEKKMKRKDKRKLEAAAAAGANASGTVPATPVTPTAVPPVPANTPAGETTSTPVSDKPKKVKRSKLPKLPAVETPSNPAPAADTSAKAATATISTSDIKEKRSSEGIEKKKAKVTGKPRKSGKAKEDIVGKTAKAKI